MEGNIEGNEDGAGGSRIQKAGKVERKRFAGQKKVKEVPWKSRQGESEIRTHLETNDAEEDDDGDDEDEEEKEKEEKEKDEEEEEEEDHLSVPRPRPQTRCHYQSASFPLTKILFFKDKLLSISKDPKIAAQHGTFNQIQ